MADRVMMGLLRHCNGGNPQQQIERLSNAPRAIPLPLDFVANFQYRRDAEAFHKNLTDRFGENSDWNWRRKRRG